MCYDKNKWHDAKDALIKSSIAVPRYCLNPNNEQDIESQLDNFEIGELPVSFSLPNDPD